MKKTINGLIGMVVIIPIFLISCAGKNDIISPTPPPCTTCSSGTKLILNANVNPGAVYITDSVQVNWTTNVIATVNGTTGTSGSYMHGPVMAIGTTLNVSGNTSDGQTASTTVNFSAYTLKNKYLTKKVALYMTSNIGCRKDSLAYPGAYHQGVIITDTLFYNPDNTGIKKKVNGNTTNLVWFFQANETGFGPAPNLPSSDPDYWIISTLDDSKFEIYQDRPDGFNPLIIWRTFLTYSKKAIL